VNIHHLELFYHVATHGGISEAVRKMPYGIQQPAVSGQILQLENDLNLKLFQRRPFHLTPAGHELLEFIEPFFSRVRETGERLRGERSQVLRLAALSTILRDHLPMLLSRHRRKFPKLMLQLHEASQAAAEDLLRKQKIDLALTELEGKPAPGIRSEILVRLPLVLLVEQDHPARLAQYFWKKGSPTEPLIALPESETLTKIFRRGLNAKKIHWPVRIEASSLEVIGAYVASGFGVAVTVLAPGAKPPARTRALRLSGGFPQLNVAALWQGKLPPIADSFLQLIRSEAKAYAAA
jgi:DNA-binding transcriptional LysR family regulator